MHGGDGRDRLVGGAGNDLALGGDGDDTIFGEAGADTLDGGAGADAIDGGDGDDLLLGGDGDDALYGRDGNDTLDGGGGADRMSGGAGDDTYYVDSVLDLVAEAENEGIDTVLANISRGTYALPPNVENLVLLGDTFGGTGNVLANQITGNDAANYLWGGPGNDTLDGGGGSDVLIGGAGEDTFLVRPGTGMDLIVDFQPGQDKLVLQGFDFGNAEDALAAMIQAGPHVMLLLGDDVLMLGNMRIGSLSANDIELL